MKLLRAVNPGRPLPEGFDELLWNGMEVHPQKKRGMDVLESEGAVPGHAYYVVYGFVLVYGFDLNADTYVWRIYRENSIVALNDFLLQEKSAYSIVAMPGALVWTIDNKLMLDIYVKWDGMREFAWQTASKYGEMKEERRAKLLAIDNDLERVLSFYKEYNKDGSLLPAYKHTILDSDIASFLNMNVVQFRRMRLKLRRIGKIIYS